MRYRMLIPSRETGKKRSTITNYMRLLKLDPIVQTGIRDGFISMGHGRALINCASPELQIKFYKAIVKKGLSVRATEDLVRNTKKTSSTTTINYQPAYIKQAAEDLEKLFETPVSVSANSQGKGQLKIGFDSQEKLHHILNQIKSGD